MHIGFLFLIIPGVYLQVAYSFATILMIDKKLSLAVLKRPVKRCRITGLRSVGFIR